MGKGEGERKGALCDRGEEQAALHGPPPSPHGTRIGIQK